ncbi:HlyD family efflux transporter periplasmic adaptor subunit [Roseateles sp. SL47]|uniref:HlyD family efflux transporter periplasmic adaptor subunit n=1 Tax=Roseateles sp. SL47 TaxID=2995138 RepID=UPI0022713DB6|nr:HlyD family efflux transporter periplasmic adaptor subunit [Roseateles sp. SL47]WAC71726.1 HlyD family efflux transporter periplasmic adaptor subunit [Roseateles sp. SL47]
MLPPLREDLGLHPGPDAPDGSPTWTLHDPASHRFFSLSWPAFELLSRWPLRDPTQLLGAVARETTLQVSEDDLQSLLDMLRANHLLVASDPRQTDQLSAHAAATRLSPGQWLLKHYLFFRIPVLQPMRWLQRSSRWVRWAFQPTFWMGCLALMLLGLVMAGRRWDEFSHTLTSYASWEGLLAIALALTGAKVLHELGHAFTATHFGCRVPTMGVAFLVMWPVLYTDTNEAWKLTSRRQRLWVGAAGMLSELALASVALVAWSVLPDTAAWAPIRSGAFLLATTTWVLTIAVNASPFMRFDGYFLLADAINMPNLHERAFALGRWWMREALFGWGDPPPERFSPARQRGLIVFAFATWLYRLVLFFGIALLVYHAFFRALGLLLMAVELVWFIARPVWREWKAWWQQRQRWHWNRASRRTLAALLALLGLLCWPWGGSVRVPAVLSPSEVQVVAAAYAAQVLGPAPQQGQAVKAGELLLQLRSPELEIQWQQAVVQEQQLRLQLEQQPFDDRLRELGPALRKQWEGAMAEVQGLTAQKERLAVRAPFPGVVVEVSDDLRNGTWVAAGERLISLAGTQGAKVDAYADEAALQGLAPGAVGTFVPAVAEERSERCELTRIDPVQLAALDELALADVHGGPIAVQRLQDGRYAPQRPTFHLRLDRCERQAAPHQEILGTVHLSQAHHHSWLGDGLRFLVSLWHREAVL